MKIQQLGGPTVYSLLLCVQYALLLMLVIVVEVAAAVLVIIHRRWVRL